MTIKNICICGGGGQCHAIAPLLASQGFSVSILTNKPDKWNTKFKYELPDGSTEIVELTAISNDPSEVITSADVVFVTVPGFLNAKELKKIRPFLKEGTFVGGVFAPNGFFFDAIDVFGDTQPLFGFQRVPLIGKSIKYGEIGAIKAYKTEIVVAAMNSETEHYNEFCQWLNKVFNVSVKLLSSYLEVSLSNSNPILHPARIYSLFSDYDGGPLQSNPLFYEEWDDNASELYIKLDSELHDIIKALPIPNESLPTVLEYYEQPDASHLSEKLRSIQAFHGIRCPLILANDGYYLDPTSRYFIEDFEYGLKNYIKLANDNNVEVPTMKLIYQWGHEFLNKYSH